MTIGRFLLRYAAVTTGAVVCTAVAAAYMFPLLIGIATGDIPLRSVPVPEQDAWM